MNMQQIRTRATSLGVRPGKLRKFDLIRTIQRTEGNFDCFGSAYDNVCDQGDCLWREDCFVIARRNGM